MLMDTPTSSNRFAPAVVWVNARFPVPARVIAADVVASTATCARKYGAASTTNSSPKVPSTFRAPLRMGRDEATRDDRRNPATLKNLLTAALPRAVQLNNIPPTPFNFVRTMFLPTRTSLATAIPRIWSPRTAGSSCSPQSPRVMNTSRPASAATSRCMRNPWSPFTRTMSPRRKLATDAGFT